jgi:glycosyltransferase involved in cell wall biosynthesis
MKIGIDLSVLQSDHRFRGIGSVVINFINNLEEADKENNQFVFFVEKEDEALAYEQLNLTDVSYKARYISSPLRTQPLGKRNILTKILNKSLGYIQYHTGDPRMSKSMLADIDRFIQFDPGRKLPRNAPRHTALFLHDLIPYILESDYLWSYSTARLNGRSRKGSVKFALQRYQYISRIKINAKRVKVLIANSKHTKSDFARHLDINPKKIHVAHLGVNAIGVSPPQNMPEFFDYTTTLWGVTKQEFDPASKPFLLFIGGTDHRRKIVELLAAFNNLRARGVDIALIMSGDSLEGISDIKNPVIKKYLEENTSYMDDIHLLGYVDDEHRDWLFEHALAFVFPSIYEGFGLPVLEAMSYGAPVITFKNTSIYELAGTKALYANDFLDIADHTLHLLEDPEYARNISTEGASHARQFTWKKTKTAILDILKS